MQCETHSCLRGASENFENREGNLERSSHVAVDPTIEQSNGVRMRHSSRLVERWNFLVPDPNILTSGSNLARLEYCPVQIIPAVTRQSWAGVTFATAKEVRCLKRMRYTCLIDLAVLVDKRISTDDEGPYIVPLLGQKEEAICYLHAIVGRVTFRTLDFTKHWESAMPAGPLTETIDPGSLEEVQRKRKGICFVHPNKLPELVAFFRQIGTDTNGVILLLPTNSIAGSFQLIIEARFDTNLGEFRKCNAIHADGDPLTLLECVSLRKPEVIMSQPS